MCTASSLSHTFSLHQGVKWHEGKEFTLADVAYSIELLKKIHPRGRNTFATTTGTSPSPSSTSWWCGW